ncbi:hypothetical protein D3C87_1866400 [compost metagenome]
MMTMPLVQHIKDPAAFAGKTLLGVVLDGEQTCRGDIFGNIGIAGHHGAAFSAGDVLDAIKAETDNVA